MAPPPAIMLQLASFWKPVNATAETANLVSSLC